MAAGVVFLASSIEDGEKAAYKAGNTDVIRAMLREQQKECQQLHANSLFREFRDEGQKMKKFGKGYAVQQEQNQPLVIDFQAEGQTRMFELIKQKAIKEEKPQPLQGVWASFGKPYICLGEPKEPPSGLPPLNRDEIANQEGKGKNNNRVKQQRAAQEQARNIGTAGSRSRSRGGTANSMGGGGKELTPAQAEEMRLVKNKTIMRFGANDLLECKFPEGPLRMAANRRTRSMVKLGAYNDPLMADMEAQDPALAYGQPALIKRQLSPIKRGHGDDLDETKNQVFITQGAGGAQEQEELDGTSSRRQSNAGHRVSHGGGTGAFRMPPRTGEPSENEEPDPAPAQTTGHRFQKLVDPAMPERGKEDNPVYGWHNKFVEVRQKGREQLQQALYERSQGRYRARSFGHMAANLCSLLMTDLASVHGKKIPYASVGSEPNNPYRKMEDEWAKQEETRKVRNQRAQTLDPDQLRVMQRFYDQLCALVEAQRMSDPLSLMVVHRVRALLEAGTSLQRPMLNTVLEHISKFTKGCGLIRHNQYMLSILTFIAKCTSTSDADFEDMVAQHGLAVVVYNQPDVPSRIAAAEAAAAEAAAAGTSSRGGRRGTVGRGISAVSMRREGKEGRAGGAGEGQEDGTGGDEAGPSGAAGQSVGLEGTEEGRGREGERGAGEGEQDGEPAARKQQDG